MSSLVDFVPVLCSYLAPALLGAVILTLALAFRLGRKSLWVLVAFVALFNAYIGVLQVYVLLNPAFDVLFLQPDRVLGWKQVPNLRSTRTGWSPYAADFSVDVLINSHGFRDLERKFPKQDGMVRIALLGGSMIEAVQVPFEKTAAQQLEKMLNGQADELREGKTRFEVLNFGVAAYGTGQDLIVWEEHASKFDLDYVFLFLSPMTLELTVQEYQAPGFTGALAMNVRLQARPIFRIEDGKLIRSQPRDFKKFHDIQQRLIDTVYGGTRSKRKFHSLARLCRTSVGGGVAALRGQGCGDRVAPPARLSLSKAVDAETIQLNLRIMEELGRQVRDAGGRFVLVDGTYRKLRPGSRELTRRLMRFSREKGFGYVDFFEDREVAEREGISVTWPRDILHFNEAGNEILAAAMYRWMRSNESYWELRLTGHPGRRFTRRWSPCPPRRGGIRSLTTPGVVARTPFHEPLKASRKGTS